MWERIKRLLMIGVWENIDRLDAAEEESFELYCHLEKQVAVLRNEIKDLRADIKRLAKAPKKK